MRPWAQVMRRGGLRENMRYKVGGTIELNWEVIVEADDEAEAGQVGKSYALDGHGVVGCTGQVYVFDILPIEAETVKP